MSELRMEVADLLQAFALAGDFVTAKTAKAAMGQQQNYALVIMDWAIANCDRGAALLELRARDAISKGDDGHITVGPVK